MLGGLKKPVVVCDNLNVRQATSMPVFKVMDTRFQFFAIDQSHRPPCSDEIQPMSSNKPLPQLFRIADWYSIHTISKQGNTWLI